MKILVISTSRADWNPLGMVAKRLQKEHEVTIGGADMATFTSIIEDGFRNRFVIHDMQSDFIGYDLAICLGDRHELVPIVFELNYAGIPIAHLSGGDITTGSKDDCFRHAITKLSHLHFPTHPDSARRIIQMGEPPSRVHMVGSPAVDRILATELPEVGIFSSWFALLNWQSESLGSMDGLYQILAAVDTVPTVAVGCNDDPQSDEINAILKTWCLAGPNRHFHQSLPTAEYLAAMKACRFMIGNSSSMFYEAPVFGTPCVYVGTRQDGRVLPNCVTDTITFHADVAEAVRAQTYFGRFSPQFHYGDGHASDKIAAVINAIHKPSDLLRKEWHYVG